MKFKFPLLSVLLIWSCTSFAQTKIYKNEVGFQTDNDGFLGQRSDRYYTAGNFFFFRHALNIPNPDSSKLQNKVLGFELGQKIYTSQSGVIPAPQFVDRPFAGYLYIGSTLNLLYKNESNLKLVARTGFVGPHAYGREIQDLIHNTFGFYTPVGWQYQIQDAFQLNLSAEYNGLLARGSGIDLLLNTNAAIGTGLTGAGAGVTVRLGKFNNLFNSISTNSTASRNSKLKPLNNGELFFYYKPSLNLVVYDASIQGDLFKDKPGINEVTSTAQPFIFSQQFGGSLVINNWMVDLSAIFETRETKQMIHTFHQWGSLSVFYRF